MATNGLIYGRVHLLGGHSYSLDEESYHQLIAKMEEVNEWVREKEDDVPWTEEGSGHPPVFVQGRSFDGNPVWIDLTKVIASDLSTPETRLNHFRNKRHIEQEWEQAEMAVKQEQQTHQGPQVIQ